MLLPSVFFTVFFIIDSITAQTGISCAPCQTVSSLLSECTLPALSTNFKTPKTNTVRNVTQAPDFFNFHPDNPSTYIITDYSSASCLCLGGRKEFTPCAGCTFYTSEEGDQGYNQYQVCDRYLEDCTSFGYWVNDTQAYPSTTHTSLPAATAPASQKVSSCGECDVLADQLLSCNETSLSGATYPPLTADIGAPTAFDTTDDGVFTRFILMNRTMAECVCTLPVLRRFAACESCGGDLTWTVIQYASDCQDMGYFTDKNVVLPSGVDSGGNPVSSSTSSTKSTVAETAARTGATSASTSTSVKNEANGKLRVCKGTGWVCSYLVFLIILNSL